MDEFTLTVDIATIDALGRNLYSNAAAVLSEFVANAWDADANNVWIDYDTGNDTISIKDDGCGMSQSELNTRFLTVGYQKRPSEGPTSSKFKRSYMGRKGIGKLSAFSLADGITVISKKNGGEPHGFRIDANDVESKMREQNAANRIYHPDPLEDYEIPSELDNQGTIIKFSDLRTQRLGLTVAALRRRIARRFDVLDLADKSPEEGGFKIFINDQMVTYEDRGDLEKLEYLWLLNGYELPEKAKTSAQKTLRITLSGDSDHPEWVVSGWLGTVAKPQDRVFAEDDDESMKNIIVVARKRPIQEGLLDHLNYDKHFSSYVTGQIQADFLDLNDEADLATSDRQRLVENDVRTKFFYQQVHEAFTKADAEWTKMRRDIHTETLFERVPAVSEWLSSLSNDSHRAASSIINRISSIDGISDDDRNSLYQSSIVAFSRLEQQHEISKLSDVETMTTEQLMTILSSYSNYEDMEYAQTVRSRLAVIEHLERMLDNNELENTTRDYVATNPWLLDPSWERATENTIKEKSFKRIAKEEFGIDFSSDSEASSRVDLKYLQTADRQVIVEFKRYGREIDISEIGSQIKRYALAMTRMLQQNDEQHGVSGGYHTNRSGVDPRVNIIIIVKAVNDDIDKKPMPPAAANDAVKIFNAKFLYFNEMLRQSRERYGEFIEAAANNDATGKAIKALTEYNG